MVWTGSSQECALYRNKVVVNTCQESMPLGRSFRGWLDRLKCRLHGTSMSKEYSSSKHVSRAFRHGRSQRRPNHARQIVPLTHGSETSWLCSSPWNESFRTNRGRGPRVASFTSYHALDRPWRPISFRHFLINVLQLRAACEPDLSKLGGFFKRVG